MIINFLVAALKVIFVLGFLVLIHEAGHFFVAKKCGIKVHEFSIGFGPKLWSKQGKETLYSIRCIPIGGYVNMEGEEERSEEEGSFSTKSAPQKIAVVAAGGLVNIIFAVVVYFIFTLSMGGFQSTNIESLSADLKAYGLRENDQIVEISDKKINVPNDISEALAKNKGEELEVTVKRNGEFVNVVVEPTKVDTALIGIAFELEGDVVTTQIDSIENDSPASQAGIKKGDKIVKVNGIDVLNTKEIREKINENPETEKVVTVLRNEENIDFTVKPKISTSYVLDVELAMAEDTVANRLYYSTLYVGEFLNATVDSVKMIFTGQVKADQLTGPIGIGSIVSEANKVEEFIQLLLLISLSLGVTNLLPFPPLDGGKIVLILIEAIRKKPLKQNVEIGIQMAGFVLIIGLSIFVAYNDVVNIIK